MNAYGFFINKSSDWWNLKSGYFRRDSPELKKILPRPRSSSRVKDSTDTETTGSVPEKVSTSEPRTSNTGSSVSNNLVVAAVLVATSRPEDSLSKSAPPMLEENSRKEAMLEENSRKEVEVTEQSTRRGARRAWLPIFDEPTSDDDLFVLNKKMRAGLFPGLLHLFICECSASHPDVVMWNSDRTAFNVETHHPTLPLLLSKYFHRKSPRNVSSAERHVAAKSDVYMCK
jgi:hypothetical protein